jgi:hypothetical protein
VQMAAQRNDSVGQFVDRRVKLGLPVRRHI